MMTLYLIKDKKVNSKSNNKGVNHIETKTNCAGECTTIAETKQQKVPQIVHTLAYYNARDFNGTRYDYSIAKAVSYEVNDGLWASTVTYINLFDEMTVSSAEMAGHKVTVLFVGVLIGWGVAAPSDREC